MYLPVALCPNRATMIAGTGSLERTTMARVLEMRKANVRSRSFPVRARGADRGENASEELIARLKAAEEEARELKQKLDAVNATNGEVRGGRCAVGGARWAKSAALGRGARSIDPSIVTGRDGNRRPNKRIWPCNGHARPNSSGHRARRASFAGSITGSRIEVLDHHLGGVCSARFARSNTQTHHHETHHNNDRRRPKRRTTTRKRKKPTRKRNA